MLDNSKEVHFCSIKNHLVRFFSAPLKHKGTLFYAIIKTPEGKDISDLYEFYNSDSFTLEKAKSVARKIISKNIIISNTGKDEK